MIETLPSPKSRLAATEEYKTKMITFKLIRNIHPKEWKIIQLEQTNGNQTDREYDCVVEHIRTKNTSKHFALTINGKSVEVSGNGNNWEVKVKKETPNTPECIEETLQEAFRCHLMLSSPYGMAAGLYIDSLQKFEKLFGKIFDTNMEKMARH